MTCFISLFLALEATPAWSADPPSPPSPWQVTADKVSRFVNPPSIIAEGNVVLVRQGLTSVGQLGKSEGSEPGGGLKPLTINGDWIRLDPTSNQVKVRGHAVLDSDEEHITADLVDLDMDRQTGHLQRATIYFPKRRLYLAGEKVEKSGDLTYHLENGWVTKCDPVNGQAPPWSFGWSRADITQEGFAHFSHAIFRVKDLPVVYSPYLAFPANTKRKTGLLFPELSVGSRDGAGILAPLFVNLSPSQDLTLYAGGLSERGPLTGIEYRYVQDVASKGIVGLTVLNDRLTDSAGDDFKSDGVYRTTADRYWLRGKADHDFGKQLNAKLDLDLVSDQDFLQEYDGLIGFTESSATSASEFGRGFEAKTTHARTNTAQLTKLWPTMTLGGEVRGVSDPTRLSSSSHPWSLPSLTFAGSRPLAPKNSSGHGFGSLAGVTDLTWDSSYVYYWREEGLGGQRIDLHPTLKAPLRFLPYLETTSAIGLRQTMYQVEDNGATAAGDGNGVLSRTIADGALATSTVFMRDFDLSGSRLRRLTHMIRPGLAYTYVPAVTQGDLPALDRIDRIAAENLVTYGISNDVVVSGANGSAWKMFYARLSQAYDIHAARRDLESDKRKQIWTDIALKSWLQPVRGLRFLYETKLDIYGDKGSNYQLGARYSTPEGDALSLAHRYASVQAINQLNLNLAMRLARTLRTQAIINYSLETNETSNTSLRLLYTPACWGLALQATTTPDDAYRVTLLFSLEGVGNVLGISQDLSTPDDMGGIPP